MWSKDLSCNVDALHGIERAPRPGNIRDPVLTYQSPSPQSRPNIISVTPPSLLPQTEELRFSKTMRFVQNPGRALHTPLCLFGVLDCFSYTFIASPMSKECEVV